MRKYLQDVISAQSSRRQERIYDLLEEARVGKEQLSVLFDRLKSGVSTLAPLQMTEETEGRYITSGPTFDNLRQIGLRMAEMYRLSNLISVLLNSHASILSSEIKTLEEELSTMEKMASNYAFLLSDAKAFDYASLEPFNDYTKMDRDATERAPDRSNSRFAPTDVAHINNKEGVLSLPRTRNVAYNIYPRILSANHMIQTRNLNRTAAKGSVEGWKSEVVSSSPITSSLPGTGAEPGAQALLEYELPEPQASSHIRISPFSNIPLYLESVKVFLAETDAEPIDLLDGPILLDRDIEFSFPLSTVAKFQIHINQRTFTRTFGEDSGEARIKELLSSLPERRRTNIVREAEKNAVRNTASQRLSPFTPRDFVSRITNLNDKTSTDSSEALRRIVWDSLDAFQAADVQGLIADSRDIVVNHVEPSILQSSANELFMRRPRPMPSVPRDGYRYLMGIKTVSLGLTDPSFKGIFVSSPLDAEGDIGEIRIKVGETQYISPDRSLHNKQFTSTEYSISNKPDPVREADWTPILPIGQTQVISERLFPNEFGMAMFRFEADRQSLIKVYKNGVEFKRYTSSYAPNGSVTGVNIPLNRMNSGDIFTADYTPSFDPTTLKIDEISNFENIPLTAAFDSSGAGEYFESTQEKNTVTLQHAPYIDRAVALSNTTYSPVSVIADDGTPAVNVTDYSNSNSSVFPDDDESYYYIHSGRKLLFNKPVQGMRVFYQYLENNVRFRVVLRCNSKDFVSPKVDYVHVKAKIRKPDQSL